MTTLSAKSIAVYLNGIQLTHDKDYTFNTDGYIEITCTKFVDDIIEIYEYESTDGSFVPATPTKTGLYRKYYPELTIDDSFIAKKPTGTGPFKVYGRTEQTTKSFKGKIGWFYPLYTSKEAAIAADSVGVAQPANMLPTTITKILNRGTTYFKKGHMRCHKLKFSDS